MFVLSLGNTLLLHYEPNRLMLSIGLWSWYINITITVLDVIYLPAVYSKLVFLFIVFDILMQYFTSRKYSLQIMIILLNLLVTLDLRSCAVLPDVFFFSEMLVISSRVLLTQVCWFITLKLRACLMWRMRKSWHSEIVGVWTLCILRNAGKGKEIPTASGSAIGNYWITHVT
jgi:hypothetical protein